MLLFQAGFRHLQGLGVTAIGLNLRLNCLKVKAMFFCEPIKAIDA